MGKSKKFFGLSALAVLALVLGACSAVGQVSPGAVETLAPTAAAVATAGIPVTGGEPSVTVEDQAVANGSVTVASVVSAGPGWMVIHADNGGSPGAVLGQTAVKAGENRDVVVKIDTAKATPVLYAMLHVDAGTVGTYEFPGADVPVMVGGSALTPSFNVTGLPAASGSTPAAGGTPGAKSTSESDDYGYGSGSSGSKQGSGDLKLMVSQNAELGKFLVDANGMTLYKFTVDQPGVSNCKGQCLVNWPPFVASGDVKLEDGVTGQVGTAALEDGRKIVTYNGMPLYYYIKDKKPGDTTGQNVGDSWFVVAP